MLACARIGAIHSVVFGGFSAESLKNRIQDCKSDIVITADGGYRRWTRRPAQADHRRGSEGMPRREDGRGAEADRQGRGVGGRP